jgi:penicillin-binding protein 1A
MKWLALILKVLFGLAFVGVFTAALVGGGAYYYLRPQLPSIENLRDVRLQVPLRVYSADQKLIAEFGEKRRLPLQYADLPQRMVEAFLAAEDDSFFSHPGVDFKGLMRAGVQLLLTGERRQGGSTITMQVARNFYLTREKTFTRKLNEIFLALRIEQDLSKTEILELYLNKIYLGQRAYGVGAAAQVYYGKIVDDLNLAQIAMIAGLPKAPSRFNPVANPERAKERRDYVLGRMRQLGYIDKAEYQDAVDQPVSAQIFAANIEVDAIYVAEMVRAQLFETYGEDAYTQGLHVYTTLQSHNQEAANKALRKALADYDTRHGYRGPEGHLEVLPVDSIERDGILAAKASVADLVPGLVVALAEQTADIYLGDGQTVTVSWDGLKWAAGYISEDRKKHAPKTAADILAIGDLVRVRNVADPDQPPAWQLSQVPQIAGALVALNPEDGAIVSLVGGYDFYQSKFNRATQARRQPGSGFKAFIYSAALEAGYTAASLINDAPVVLADASLEGDWRPKNYSGKFFGPTRLRYALTKSRNLVSIRLLRSMGIEHALDHIQLFGFKKETLPNNLSLALGSGSVTPLEMARGYAVLANGGFLVDPYLIARVEQGDQGEIFRATPAKACSECASRRDAGETTLDRLAPRVISPENRYLMYSMMQDVIRAGTATKALALGRKDIAGKTGTTNDQRDAWFNGYNQSLVAVVWVGFDSNEKLGRGEVGGRAALPAWIEFMKTALAGTPDVSPQTPSTMIAVRIDPATGERAPSGMKGAIYEVFRANHTPALTRTTGKAAPIGGARGTGAAPPVEDLF